MLRYIYFFNLFALSMYRNGSVKATINDIFSNTNITQDTHKEVLTEAINHAGSGLLSEAEFQSKYCLYTIQVFHFGDHDMNEPQATFLQVELFSNATV